MNLFKRWAPRLSERSGFRVAASARGVCPGGWDPPREGLQAEEGPGSGATPLRAPARRRAPRGGGGGMARGARGRLSRVLGLGLLAAAVAPPPVAESSGAARVAVANVVHEDGRAEVRLFGHSAAGEAFEGLRVTADGAASGNLGLGAALAAAVTPVIRLPALPLVVRHGGGTRWAPSVRFASPDLSPALEWSVVVADPAIATAYWAPDLGAFNITDAAWAGPDCGGGGAYESETTLDVTVAVTGLGPVGTRTLAGVPVTVRCDPSWEGKIVWHKVLRPASFTWDSQPGDFGVAEAGGRLFKANRAWNGGSFIHNYLVEIETFGRELRELERPPPTTGSFAMSDPQLIALGPGDLMLLGGDSSSGGPKKDVYRWREGRGWSFLPSMANQRSNGVAAAVLGDGRIAVAGGYGYTGTLCTETAEIYDPDSGAWASLPDLPKCMQAVSGAALGGKLHFVGGLEFFPRPPPASGGTLAAQGYHFILEPGAGGTFNWIQLGGLPSGRERGSGKLVNVEGTLYFIGGTCCNWPGTKQNKVDRYDPGTDTWHAVEGTIADANPSHPEAGGAAALGGELFTFGLDGQLYHGALPP